MEKSKYMHITTTKMMTAEKESLYDCTGFSCLEGCYRIRLRFIFAALRPTWRQI